MRLLVTAALFLVLAPGALRPQDSPDPGPAACHVLGPNGPPLFLDGLRIAELAGTLAPGPLAHVRPSTRRRACDPSSGPVAGIRVDLLPVRALAQNNSAYPREDLNGLRWAGRGFSFDVSAGAAASWGPVSAAFAPVFAWHENRPFDFLEVTRPGTSPYAWYWRPRDIDWPQRFGGTSFAWWHPGESHLRVDAYGVAAGFSTETLRWGPARRNPLLMSGASPGFPHVFLGTSRPVGIGIGRLSAEAVWGHLAESDYFEGDEAYSRRMIAGLVVMLQPYVLDGLTIGIARSELRTIPPEGFSLLDYLLLPYAEPLANTPGGPFDGENQLFSVYARWAFPETGFEVYAEYGREDLWDGWDDFFKEIDHSAAIAFGIQKLTPLRGDRSLRIAGEVASLNFSETQRSGRIETIWYTHHQVRQGYTHRGRLLGAPIGPGSDAQYLEVDVLSPGWVAGAYVSRIRFHKDNYYQSLASRYTYKGHDVELTGGVRGALLRMEPGIEVTAELALSGRYNRGWVDMLGPYNETWERNLMLRLGASWRPAFGRTFRAGGPPSPPTQP
jgi:hypothetical protein